MNHWWNLFIIITQESFTSIWKTKQNKKHLFEEIYVELSDYGTTWQEVFVGGRFQLSTNLIIPFICTEYTWSHMIVWDNSFVFFNEELHQIMF